MKTKIDFMKPEELDRIARLHFAGEEASAASGKGPRYRFYRDKVELFYAFDRESILVGRNEAGEISGVLIYTYDEPAFNRFCGARQGRFYLRVLKTLMGWYGFDFRKFFYAAKSMLGKSSPSEVAPEADFGKIWVLIVRPEDRRSGIASELIQSSIRQMARRKRGNLQVTVTQDNLPAIRAYDKVGFHRVGTVHESCGDSFVMQRAISQEDLHD